MTEQIRVLPTRYSGFNFRSRTEARWAVFFDAAHIRWEYEREGFALPSGWYLPDFWLPDVCAWLEVKGTWPTDREIRLAEELVKGTGFDLLFGIGAPDANSSRLPTVTEEGFSAGSMFSTLLNDELTTMTARRAFTNWYGKSQSADSVNELRPPG